MMKNADMSPSCPTNEQLASAVMDLSTAVHSMVLNSSKAPQRKASPPPKFDGDSNNLDVFLERFEIHCDTTDIHPQRAASILLELLSDNVYRHVHRLGLTRQPELEPLVNELRNTYGLDRSTSHWRRELDRVTQEPGESYEELRSRITFLAQKAFPKCPSLDTEVRDRLVDCLADPTMRLNLSIKLETHPH